MMRVLRDFRLLPLVLLATVSLLALKSFGLVFDGGYILGPPAADRDANPSATADPGESGDIVGSIAAPPEPKPAIPDDPAVTVPVVPAAPADIAPANRRSWAQEMFNFPDVTGSVGGGDKKTDANKDAKKGAPGASAGGKDGKDGKAGKAAPEVRTAAKNAVGKPVSVLDQRQISPSERAILERLQERRKDLEAQARKLEMRESLLMAAEKRLESRVSELKEVEGRIKTANDRNGGAEAGRFKGLVSMYENMKAKDAARIFDRLDLKILADLAGNINPRRMADILANMSPEAAERLTVEFASRGGAQKASAPAQLPKIEGFPTPGP